MFGESELVIEDTYIISRLGEIVMTSDKWDVHKKIALRCQMNFGQFWVDDFARFNEIGQNDFQAFNSIFNRQIDWVNFVGGYMVDGGLLWEA